MYEHLKEYNDIYKRIKELRLKLESIEHEIYDIKSPKLDDMPRSPSPKDVLVYMIAEKDEIAKELAQEKSKLAKKKRVHLKEIAKVDDLRYRSILRSYYLDKVDKNEIARAEGITLGHFYKLKREAVEAFKQANNLNDTK